MNADAKPRDARAELETLHELLREDNRNLALLRHCARLALEIGDYGAALSFATTAVNVLASDPEARFQQATALMGLKRYAEAARIWSELRGIPVMQPAVDTNLALCCYVERDYAAARPILESLMTTAAPGPDVIRLFVSTLHHLGDLSAAVAVADRHAEAGARDGAVAGVYALVYLDATRPMEAMRFAVRARAANPDSVDGLVVEATLKLSRLDVTAAEKGFRRAAELMPGAGRAWVGLGSIALLGRDFPHAVEYLERGVEAMPTHVGSWQVLGWTYLLMGNLDAAERVFQRAVDMDRNFAEAHGSMASIYAMRGRVAEAKREIEIAERLDRSGLAASYAKAVLMGRAGDPEAGRALILETVAGLAPRLGGRAAQLLTGAVAPPTATRH